MLPIAVDAMGGDRGPAEIVAGAARAAEEQGIPVVLVGPPDAIGDPRGLEVIPCTEVIGMHEEGARAVRRKKDASLVVAAEAVRDGRASAMISAGNTGATVAAALLRVGRLSGVARPAIATPIPVPGSTPTVLLDAGANPECTARWLVQFAQMGSAFARERYGIDDPRVALLNIGEEATKGTAVHREAHALLAAGAGVRFIGNVEGRDLISDAADVVVADGFTGNVALKTLEGGLARLRDLILEVMTSTDEARQAAKVLIPLLMPLAEQLDPDSYGGAMALGLRGVCIISHGSSSARAITNAVNVAAAMVSQDVVAKLQAAVAVRPAGGGPAADGAPEASPQPADETPDPAPAA